MADVEWDPDIHYLAKAEHDILGTVIMVRLEKDTNEILCIYGEPNAPQTALIKPTKLVPAGKQYRKES